jgi:hypothetical protein
MSGEIELLTQRDLTYFVGHDSGGLAGRQKSADISGHPGYLSGFWYLPPYFSNVSSGTAPGSGSIRLYPAYIRKTITISALGLRVITASAGGNVQAAIYANDPATNRPTGNPLASTASMSTASAASVSATASVTLSPGLYWFATNCDNATAAFTGATTTVAQGSWLIGSATQANCLGNGSGTLSGLSFTQAFGTWPDLTAGSFTELTGSTAVPLIQFKIA